jgi:hypothetical protein
MATEEVRWAKEHPDPQALVASDRLILWNYPVGKGDLAPPHQDAIRRFVGVAIIGSEVSTAEFSVRGHASRSGEGVFDNVDLSRRRARNVGGFLRSLGFRNVTESAAGAAEPSDPSPAGQSTARNRRVEVTMFVPPPPQTSVPVTPGSRTPAQSRQQPRRAPSAGPNAVITDLKLKLIEVKGENAWLAYEIAIEATLKARVEAPEGDPLAVAAIWDGKTLSTRFESELGKYIKQKLVIEPPSDGKPAAIKLGYEGSMKIVPLKFEMGFQSKPLPVYVSSAFADLQLEPLPFGNAVVRVALSGKIKGDFAPSKAFLARTVKWILSVAEGTAAAETAGVTGAAATTAVSVAAVGGGVALGVAVTAGLASAVEDAKQAFSARLIAVSERDGASAKAAYYALGPDIAAGYEEFKAAHRDPSLRAAFDEGVLVVDRRIQSQSPSDRDGLKKAWKDSYGKKAAPLDFKIVQFAIFLRLGGIDTTVRDLSADVSEL